MQPPLGAPQASDEVPQVEVQTPLDGSSAPNVDAQHEQDQDDHQGAAHEFDGDAITRMVQEQEDDGPIQRQHQAPHPRVHQSIQRDHPVDNILRSIRREVTTRSCLAMFCEFY